MMVNNLVSIAMATYNGEKYLSQQLDSILNQTHPIYEIIIVDDGSSDGTLNILNAYRDKYSNIKVYPNPENLGVVKSFERAIMLASGDYVALADQDDVWFNNKIEVLVAEIGDNLLIHSDAVLVDDDLNVLQPSHFAWGKQADKEGFFNYLVNSNVTGCTVLMSRELINLTLPFRSYVLPHDWYFSYYAAYCGRIKLYLKPLIYYRQHAVNVSGAKKKTFAQYRQNCLDLGSGYNDLLKDKFFAMDKSLVFMCDYKLSLYSRRWHGENSIFQLLKMKKQGVKLLVFYFMMTKLPLSLSERFYNILRKFI
jgi:glycosyltransferase involved in cell wall biosynthesis